uniref:Evolutionarily conserved signaling intermediate in Toll pathway, mitochondrial n=1 Tax=Clastoptera arizonana TaxID=38151 RepID=A0A1B6C3D7_9HEMI
MARPLIKCILKINYFSSKSKFSINNLGYISPKKNSYNLLQIRNYADSENKSVATLQDFNNVENKDKNTYLDLLHIYKGKVVHRRGHVEFINTALKHMEEFGVERDLEVYKALIDVMPKGKFIPSNIFQAEFMHYPKQQQCIIDVLEQMEDFGVIPDFEMEDLLVNIFGRKGHPVRRYWRMMYWMPKFKNLSPWPVPKILTKDSLELGKLAIQRITSVDVNTNISVFETKEVKDSIDDTWIVSGQSAEQQELLKSHDTSKPLFVEGSFRLWLRQTSVNYFILRADPKQKHLKEIDPDDIRVLLDPLFSPPEENVVTKESVHEQEDGTIFAVCATGSSSRDSLLSWIRLLEKENPSLGEIPVLFTLKSPVGYVEPLKEIEASKNIPSNVNVENNIVDKG